MGAATFIPLVKDSPVVKSDPSFPDDIELTHEKHRRVLGAWELEESQRKLVVSGGDEPDKLRRRRRIMLIASVWIMCVGIVGVIVAVLGPWGLFGRSKPDESPTARGPSPTTPMPTPIPSSEPTEVPRQTPVSGSMTFRPYGTSRPTSAPSMAALEEGMEAPASPSFWAQVTTASDSPAPTLSDEDLHRDSSAPYAAESFTSYRPSVLFEASPGLPPVSTRVCNGLASNCERPVNQVVFATLHNAMSSQEDGFYEPSHTIRLEDALDAGYRGIMIESCDCDVTGLQLCSSFCSAGTREPSRVFDNLVDFLERNPHEIIILWIQVDDETLYRLFHLANAEVPNLRTIMYSHGDSVEWPTLNELIDMEKRLIVFQHGGPDCTQDYACPRKVHNTYDYMFETPTNLTTMEDLLNFNKSCTVQQGSLTSDFFILNHYTSDALSVVNTEAHLWNRMEACRERMGRDPSLLAVDHWDVGDVLQVVQQRNVELAGEANV